MAADILTGHATAIEAPGSPFRFQRTLVATIVVVALLAIVLLVSTVLNFLGPTARWYLLLLVLVISTCWALVWVFRRSSALAPLGWNPGVRDARLWQVEELTTLLARARRSMTYSQLVVAQRVRDVLLEKARVQRNLTYEEVNRLRRKSAALQAFLGDPELTHFVLFVDDAPNLLVSRSIPEDSILKLKGDDFLRVMESLMDRVEAWR